MIEMLGTNPPNTLHYLNALLIDERNPNPDLIKNLCGQLIAECIINDLPLSYYEEIFDFNPESLEFLFNELIISTNFPESEYARIYALLTNIFEKYSSALSNIPNFTIIRMIIDVRFGSFELQNLNFEALGDKLKSLLIKAALLANKNFLFLCAERDLDRILEFQNLNVNDVQAKSFKVVFEMIQSNPDKFKNESHSLFHFVMKFYAVKNLKLKGDFIYYDFVASENLLEFGFPPGLQIKWRRSTDGRIMEFIQLDMKVLNETAINTFIPDLIEYYENHFIRGTPLYTSYEFIEFISTFRNILLLLLEYGIKLEISSNCALEKLEKYFDLDNFDLTSRILESNIFYDPFIFIHLKSRDHLEKMCKIHNIAVCESFLRNEFFFTKYRQIISAKMFYFDWHSVFTIWIKGSDKERIKEIKNPEFIEMLKLEFPNETRELFESEQT
jgi:hypothetical protein